MFQLPKTYQLFTVVVLFVCKANAYAQQSPNNLKNIPSVWTLTLNQYLDKVDQRKPSITGGCITLTSATFSTTLLLMTLDVSENHVSPQDSGKIETLKMPVKIIRDSLEILADLDNNIYQKFILAYRLSSQTSEEKQAKDSVIHQLLIQATNSLLNAGLMICSVFNYDKRVEDISSKNVFSDVKSSEILLNACFKSISTLAADNISQLSINERPAYQNQLIAIINKENLMFSTLNPPAK